MLSTLTPDGLRNVLADDWPHPLTSHGPRNVDELLAELADVRRRGYSIDKEGVREGMHCFGAPVFGPNTTEAVAGVAVSILTNELDAALQEQAREAMRRLANRLSERLGSRLRS